VCVFFSGLRHRVTLEKVAALESPELKYLFLSAKLLQGRYKLGVSNTDVARESILYDLQSSLGIFK